MDYDISSRAGETSGAASEIARRARDKYSNKAHPRDVAGDKAIDFQTGVEEFELDFDANSIGIAFDGVREVYGLLVSSAPTLDLNINSLEVYLSDTNQTGSWREYRDFIKEDLPDGSFRLLFRTPQATGFVKLHSIIDNRNLLNLAIGTPQVTGNREVLVKAYYYVRNRSETYTYTDRGDRRSYAYTQEDQAPEAGTYAYYPNSELLKTDGTFGYVYDGNGNLIAKGTSYLDHGDSLRIYDEGIAWIYEWDAFSRLIEVLIWDQVPGEYKTVASYQYNYKGERIQRTGPEGVTRFAYDQAGQLVMTEYPDGSAEQLVWMGNRLFAREIIAADGTRTRRYYGTDHLGTTILQTDEDGQMVSQGATTPFGLSAGTSGTESMAVRYTGKDLDPDTGLYYFNARWMDPSTGRFLSEDPARDGVLWYGYVGNNPLSFVDPSGLEAAEFYNSLGKPGADRSYEAYERALGTGSVGSRTYHADFDDEDWERYTGIDLSLSMARSELQGRLQYLMEVEGVRPDNNGGGVYNAAELSVLELADQIYALEKAREELLPKGFRDAMLGRAYSEALNAVPLIGGVNMVIEAVRGVESFSGIRLNSTERTLRGVAAGLELIAVIAPTVRSIVKNNAFQAVLTGGMPAAGKVLTLNPATIRFSQSSISPGFKAGGTVDDVIVGLRNGTIGPSDVPPIRLLERDGLLFTLDNRRLYAFQQAGVNIPYRMATAEEIAQEAWKFTTTNSGASVFVRGR